MNKKEEVLYFELMNKADQADSREMRLEYLRQASALNPKDVETAALVVSYDDLLSDIEKLESLDKIIKKEEKRLKAGGYFKHDMGDFWLVHETRPYMKLLSGKVNRLIYLGRTRDAIALCEEMIKLSETDNLGMRYTLMSLYALMIDEKGARNLMKKFEERSVAMLLPLSILEFRLGNYKECDHLIDEIDELNHFMLPIAFTEPVIDEPDNYTFGSIEEAIITYHQNEALLKHVQAFGYHLADMGFTYFEKIFNDENAKRMAVLNGQK